MMLMQGPEGLTIDGTVPGSPAERAGLEQGDRVMRVNGTPLDELPAGELGKVFGKPDEILLVVQRGGSEVELKVTPERAN